MRPWTNNEIEYLKANYMKQTTRDIAGVFGRTYDDVKMKRYELGLYKMKLEKWTKEQTQYLISHYQFIGDKELAEIFNEIFPRQKKWTLKHIEKKRFYLKLKRSEEQLKKIKQRNKKRGCWKTGKTWRTRGTVPIGTIRTWNIRNRFYKVIKTEKGFVLYGKYLYEKHYGTIPPGMVVTYKDGNPINVSIENLILISRADIAIQNKKKSMQYPDDIKTATKLFNKLNKIIKNYEKQINNHLFATLERLNDEDLKKEDVQTEIQKAKAISGIAKNIIDNAKTMLEGAKYAYRYNNAENPLPALFAGKNQGENKQGKNDQK